MILSLIIPVYNVEKYISRCLLSCVNQDISKDDYEIIIINDGSTDKSIKIIERIIYNSINISLITQVNKGLSEARNAGLELAKGDYIWFIDSDDWIKENCLSQLCQSLSNIDILALGYIESYENESLNKNHLLDVNVNSGKELFMCNFFQNAQFYIYRKDFLIDNSLRFFPGIYHEDFEFTPKMLYYAEKVKVYKTPVYYFFKRPNSITTSFNPKRAFDLIKVASSLNEFHSFVDDPFKVKLSNLIGLAINNSLYIASNKDFKMHKDFNSTFFKVRRIFKHLIFGNINKYRFEGLLFYCFPNKYILIYKLMRKIKFGD